MEDRLCVPENVFVLEAENREADVFQLFVSRSDVFASQRVVVNFSVQFYYQLL